MLSNVILATLRGVYFATFTEEKTQARQWRLYKLPEKLYSHKQSRTAQNLERDSGRGKKEGERAKEG